MALAITERALEHLSPHDLVTYFRCPREMAWHRALGRGPQDPRVIARVGLPDAPPVQASPLSAPPHLDCRTHEGRPDIRATDVLIYQDPGERGLPIIFAAESVQLDPTLPNHGPNLIDTDWGLSGRPDMIVRSADGDPYPIEYKATHLFGGMGEIHGRLFDVIQAIVECRLVHVALKRRPTRGLVWYGDVAGEGEREGWVEVPYRETEEGWLAAALDQVREDRIRSPVPSVRNCPSCEANRLGFCHVAAARYCRVQH